MTHELAKADQIAHRCYSKLCLLLHDARSLSPAPATTAKVDKWFNLETPDPGAAYKESVAPYRALSDPKSPRPVAPLELEVLLSVPELAPNQVLVHRQPNGGPRVSVEPTPRLVLLETWTLSFGSPTHANNEGDLTPAGMYKHGIAVFRAVYALLRVLPVWALRRRLARRAQGFGLILRVRAPATAETLGFGRALGPAAPPLSTRTVALPGVPHPSGSLSLSVRHLEHPHGFGVDERESLLSSRLLSLDADNDFTPTLVKHANATSHTRDSLSSEPSTAALRTSLPASPPQAVPGSVGSRHARTTSFPVQSASASPGRPSVSGSSREYGPIPGAAARLRKESTGSARSGSAADLPSSPGPLPIRRPQLNPLNPFKSSTLSSSPSINSPSPSLRGGTLPLPSRPHASPTSSRQEAMNTIPLPSLPASITSSGLANAPSPGPIPARQGAGRPSPPVPSSAGLPGSAGAGGRSVEGGGTKRYSSSFGHRRQRDSGEVSTGIPGSIGTGGVGVPGSVGSGSSSGALHGSNSHERQRRPSAPATSAAAAASAGLGLGLGGAGSFEDDDLSTFVSLTDAPRPLNRHYRASATDPYSPAELAAQAADPSYTAGGGGGASAQQQQSGLSGLAGRRPPHGRVGSFGSSHSQPASHAGSPLRPPGNISPLGSPGLPRRSSPSIPPTTSSPRVVDITSPTDSDSNALGLGGVGRGGLDMSRAAIDAQLSSMNDQFEQSMRALGSRRRERTQSSPGPSTFASSSTTTGAGGEGRVFTGFRRADRISEVTEESTTGTATSTASSSRMGGTYSGGRSGSTSNAGSVRGGYSGSSGSLRRPDSVGSEEVIGKLELDRHDREPPSRR